MKKKLKNFHVISQGGSQKAIKVGCQLPTGEGGHLPPAAFFFKFFLFLMS